MNGSDSKSSIPAPRQIVTQAGIRYYGAAALGSVAIGILLPFFLVCLRLMGKPQSAAHQFVDWGLDSLFVAMFFCGPGAFLLALVLFKVLMLESQARNWSQARTFVWGAVLGPVFATINFPGYFVGDVLKADDFIFERVMLLFAVAGTTCGLWVAWQAWRASHRHEKFLPRFSLRTLMLMVVLWGCAMLAFQPRDWPDQKPHKAHHGER